MKLSEMIFILMMLSSVLALEKRGMLAVGRNPISGPLLVPLPNGVERANRIIRLRKILMTIGKSFGILKVKNAFKKLPFWPKQIAVKDPSLMSDDELGLLEQSLKQTLDFRSFIDETIDFSHKKKLEDHHYKNIFKQEPEKEVPKNYKLDLSNPQDPEREIPRKEVMDDVSVSSLDDDSSVSSSQSSHDGFSPFEDEDSYYSDDSSYRGASGYDFSPLEGVDVSFEQNSDDLKNAYIDDFNPFQQLDDDTLDFVGFKDHNPNDVSSYESGSLEESFKPSVPVEIIPKKTFKTFNSGKLDKEKVLVSSDKGHNAEISDLSDNSNSGVSFTGERGHILKSGGKDIAGSSSSSDISLDFNSGKLDKEKVLISSDKGHNAEISDLSDNSNSGVTFTGERGHILKSGGKDIAGSSSSSDISLEPHIYGDHSSVGSSGKSSSSESESVPELFIPPLEVEISPKKTMKEMELAPLDETDSVALSDLTSVSNSGNNRDLHAGEETNLNTVKDRNGLNKKPTVKGSTSGIKDEPRITSIEDIDFKDFKNEKELKDLVPVPPLRLGSNPDLDFDNSFSHPQANPKVIKEISNFPKIENWPFDEPVIVSGIQDEIKDLEVTPRKLKTKPSEEIISSRFKDRTSTSEELGSSSIFDARWEDFFGVSDRTKSSSTTAKIENRANDHGTKRKPVRLGSFFDQNNERLKNTLNSRAKVSSDQSFTTQNSGTSSQLSGSSVNPGGTSGAFPFVVGSNIGGSSNTGSSSNTGGPSNTGDFSNGASIPGNSGNSFNFGNGAFRPYRPNGNFGGNNGFNSNNGGRNFNPDQNPINNGDANSNINNNIFSGSNGQSDWAGTDNGIDDEMDNGIDSVMDNGIDDNSVNVGDSPSSFSNGKTPNSLSNGRFHQKNENIDNDGSKNIDNDESKNIDNDDSKNMGNDDSKNTGNDDSTFNMGNDSESNNDESAFGTRKKAEKYLFDNDPSFGGEKTNSSKKSDDGSEKPALGALSIAMIIAGVIVGVVLTVEITNILPNKPEALLTLNEKESELFRVIIDQEKMEKISDKFHSHSQSSVLDTSSIGSISSFGSSERVIDQSKMEGIKAEFYSYNDKILDV